MYSAYQAQTMQQLLADAVVSHRKYRTLCRSTGRTIGIIWHVSELKEQMGQRIKVVVGRYGSNIKTIS